MALANDEVTALLAIFAGIEPDFCSIGFTALQDLFKDHPELQEYFKDMDLNKHGGTVMCSAYGYLKCYGTLPEDWARLQELHTNKLKLTVEDIKLLAMCIVVVIVSRCAAVDRSALEKFLNEVAESLIIA
ncbi:hemoglobin heart muscle subunit alpha-type-like [Dendropsophus ebraccatus]|uniref:hemoglobin heart muscle subunit alpha-type-like n=1 Tax=Dendropsophus ebraccatus TaxID=150705 RepID=UPI00383133B1